MKRLWQMGWKYDADKGDGGGGGDPDGGDDKPGDKTTKTFTQEDVDRIVGERAKRAGDSAVAKFLETLGVKDAEEARAKLKAAADAAQAQLSEAEKLKARNSELEAAAREATERARATAVSAAIKLAAAAQNFRNPETAAKLIDRAGIEVADDGTVSGVDAALKALAKAEPYLLKGKDGADSDIDATRRGRGDLVIDEKEEAEFKKRYGLR